MTGQRAARRTCLAGQEGEAECGHCHAAPCQEHRGTKIVETGTWFSKSWGQRSLMAGDIGEWNLAPFVFEGERKNPRGAQALSATSA